MEDMFSCSCIGYGYVPMQKLNTVCCPADALRCGSIFPELVLTIDEYGKACKTEVDKNESM